MAIVSLITDFGNQDWFAGTMKGVILVINPHATVVDITHEIPPGDIRAGAFALAASCRFFPKGTVHIAVVDPGVGSGRKAIVVQTSNYLFVGPDNGVLSWALAKEKVKTVRALDNQEFFLQPVSQTFHGRDIFAPVAGHLSCDVPLRRFGPALKDFVRLAWPEAKRAGDIIRGEVVYVDRFGNAITNIDARALGAGRAELFAGRRRLCHVGAYYQAVPKGKPVAVLGSSGFLEISVNGGNAARGLALRIGNVVTLRTRRDKSWPYSP